MRDDDDTGREDGATRRPAWPHKHTAAAIAARQAALRALPQWDAAHDFLWQWPIPAEQFAGAQEALTGHLLLLVGVVGPLRVSLGAYAIDPSDGRLLEQGRRTE